MQEYFAIRRRYSPRRVCETQISKKYAGISKRSQRGGLENFSFLSLRFSENPWFYWVFGVFLCSLREAFLAVFSQSSRNFLAFSRNFWSVSNPFSKGFRDYSGQFNNLRRHIEAVITRLSWKQFGSESPRGFESLCLRQSLGALCSKAFFLFCVSPCCRLSNYNIPQKAS